MQKNQKIDTLVAKLIHELFLLQADFRKSMDEKNAAVAEVI